jgi:hypothetical protein
VTRHDTLKENIVSTLVAQQNQDSPMYEIPYSVYHTSKEQHLEKVSTLKTFLQSCVKLLNDPSSVEVSKNILDICNTEV